MSTRGANHEPSGGHVIVIGGGLAGITAALAAADGGARVTLLERRRRLGGLTWSFDHDGHTVDNGQHVFLRCCDAYLAFLDRIGSAADVTLQDRLAVSVLRPGGPGKAPRRGRIARSGLPAPAHLAASLVAYPFLSVAERAALGRAVLPLRRMDLDDPRLDDQTFGAWLEAHGQSRRSIEVLWDLITVATVNLPAAEASLAMGAKVFQTGLLTDSDAADIGWATVPLGVLHGARSAAALERAGVTVDLAQRVRGIGAGDTGWTVRTDDRILDGDAVIVALPHTEAGTVLPPGAVAHQDRLGDLGYSPIVDVHLTYDRPVTDEPLLAGIDTPLQWVFDRTASSGLDRGQYLAISLSAAGEAMGRHPDDLAAATAAVVPDLLPRAAAARLTGSLVTKERTATFRAVPGAGALRPPARTAFDGLWVAGAWTDTGWPATMEGACRSGQAAAAGALATLRSPTHRTPQEVA